MEDGEGSLGPEDTEIEHQDHPGHNATQSTNRPDAEGVEDEEEEEDEEEPRLKYANITKQLGPLHRGGDASSAFFVAGDKMIFGTHNGNVHVLSLPQFRLLKYYHVHTASVSCISISPNPPPIATTKVDGSNRLISEVAEQSSSPTSSPAAKGSPRPGPVPNTASNQIYVATASIDGNVCVQSLVDSKNVQLRNFGRPVLAVALSPRYTTDKTYLSAGQAGSLVLTVGGQTGRSANATTTGTVAAASGWLGSIGLGSDVGTDKVLHSGEGAISTIKWSLSGKYVLWVNEEGIKVMRSNIQVENNVSGNEWKRIGHIPKPNRPGWEDLAGVWKARVDWVDRSNLETLDQEDAQSNGTTPGGVAQNRQEPEEAVVGWGDTLWLIKVSRASTKRGEETSIGKVEIMTIMHFNDCTISGVSQYTSNLVLVLAYMENKQGSEEQKSGRRNRQNALEPELRLVDIATREEVDADTLTINRYETLAAADYHLMILPPLKVSISAAQRNYLAALGTGIGTIGTGIGTISSGIYSGVETVGQGMIDVTMYPTRMLGGSRLFSGTDSVRSAQSGGEKLDSSKGANYLTSWIPTFGFGKGNEELNDVGASQGSKIFICSPYDCVVAVKRNLADRVQWLITMERYEQAWALLDQHPEAVASNLETPEASSPPTPSKASSLARTARTLSPSAPANRQQASLAEFFAESSSIASPSKSKEKDSSAENEKRRIGELWLKELTSAGKWAEAGEVAGRVLNTTARWEHWAWIFIQNKKFDEIAPFIPTFQITPPLPSVIFEVILGHYVSKDRVKLQEYLNLWPSDLFVIADVHNAVEDQLSSDDVKDGSDDWRILQECLAKLCLADGQYSEALRCYVRLQDADTALALVKEHHLVDTITDDIPSFVMLRIPDSQKQSLSREVLEELSSEPIKLLVDEATTGVVDPSNVVSQLELTSNQLFLYFYLRALWHGEGTKHTTAAPRVGQRAAATALAADEGKTLVDQFADKAVELFAEYDRPLLLDFLHTSTTYTFDKAMKICEQRHFIEELVYLLSNTGQLRKALFLIIDELHDVSKAISFAKEQDDKGLWEDLLEYSMSRPTFISGLLAEAGTAINPIELVKRIPTQLEVEGLKEGLLKLIREFDLQDSISTCASKIFYGEVAISTTALRTGRRRGIRFDLIDHKRPVLKSSLSSIQQQPQSPVTQSSAHLNPTEIKTNQPGRCAVCAQFLTEHERETIVGFACGHVYHLSHLLQSDDDKDTKIQDAADEEDQEEATNTFSRTVGPKVTHARLLKDRIEAVGGCKVCKAASVDV